MSTSDIKNYFNGVLGDRLRCLLPSFWFKRMFNMTLDKIDEVDNKVENVKIELPTSRTIAKWGFTKNKGTVTSITAGEGINTNSGDPITDTGTISLKPASYSSLGGVKLYNIRQYGPSRVSYNHEYEHRNFGIEADSTRRLFVTVPPETFYGECDTAASVSIKTVPLVDYSNSVKIRMVVKFTNANTAANPSLSPGSGKTKPIYFNGAPITEQQYWSAGAVIEFFYDGSYYHMLGAVKDADVVQSDWNVADTTAAAYIKNKPVALKNPSSLTFGSKTYDGSAAQTITAADLGLSSALKYCGITTTNIADDRTTASVTINNASYTPSTGDIVFYGDKEFVWNGSKWEELGYPATVDTSTFKTKQTAVSDPTASTTTSTTFIDTISQDANGVITVTKKTLPTYTNVTESTVSGWGFTKNTGTYSKPSNGIPKSDLASAVQTSLDKADTALQSYTEKYTGTYNKPSTGIPKTDLASAVQTSLGKADTALQSYTEQYKGTVTSITPGTGLTGASSDSAITTSGTINLKTATTSEIGGIKPAAVRASGISVTTGGTTSDRYYGVELDANGKAFVNVPWVDANIKTKTVFSGGTSSSPMVLEPNTLTVISGSKSSLYLTFTEGRENEHYMIQFTPSSSGCALSLPDTVKWYYGVIPDLPANYTVQISIYNNMAVGGAFI